MSVEFRTTTGVVCVAYERRECVQQNPALVLRARVGGGAPRAARHGFGGNTNGGLIGEGYIHGLNMVTEAVRQIRGTAANQLHSVDVALVSASRTGAILTRT